MDAIARELDIDRTEVRARNFIQPEEFPYDQGLIFQDGRPLIYDSGDYPASLEKLKELVGWDEFQQVRDAARAEGRRVGIGLACYVEGTGVGPYEGGHVIVETSGKVKVATGPHQPGPGAPDRVRADRRGRARRAARRHRGHHRRHPTIRLCRRHIRLARRGHERLGDRARGTRCAREDPQGRGRGARGEPGRSRDRGRHRPGEGRARRRDRSRHGRRAVESAAVLLRHRVAASHAVRQRRHVQAAGAPRTTSRASRDATTSRRCSRRSRAACTRSSSRPIRTRPRSRSCATASCTTAAR